MYIKVRGETYKVEFKNKPNTSNKSYGNKYKDNEEKELILAISASLAPVENEVAYRDALNKYETIKANFKNEMFHLLNSFLKKEIEKSQFIYHARRIFKKYYELAFIAGNQSTGLYNPDLIGLPEEDYKWLDKVRREEYKYLTKFLDDIENGRGTMDYHERMNMYIDTLDSVFQAGRVDALPTAITKIYWVLSDAEHCPDCIALASGSPYTTDTLPTTPRAGDTRCLTRCKCKLSIKYDYNAINMSDVAITKVDNYDDSEEAIDWDVIHDITNLLYEKDNIKAKTPNLYMEKMQELTEQINEKIDKLNIEIPIRSVEFKALHLLGSYIKDVIRR